jgi:predicted RNA-binding Zn-ribbon protein involved in translation (DUF1610 family)
MTATFTSMPDTPAPVLLCPTCASSLIYRQSVLRGENPPARWDYFVCRTCGPFEYPHHTGELRRTSKRLSWFCPACDTRLQHHGDAPRADRIYQCHGCGSTLALNPVTNLMGAPPPRPDPAIVARRRRRTSDQRMF